MEKKKHDRIRFVQNTPIFAFINKYFRPIPKNEEI